MEKIERNGDDLYLPTATNKYVRGIQVDSGIPLQSAAKVPIMITFNVVDKDGDPNDIKPQACIFKVALLVISIIRFFKRVKKQYAYQYELCSVDISFLLLVPMSLFDKVDIWLIWYFMFFLIKYIYLISEVRKHRADNHIMNTHFCWTSALTSICCDVEHED